MGLLDQVIGSVLARRRGSGLGPAGSAGLSPVVTALIALLASQALGRGAGGAGGLEGALGGVLGHGRGQVPPEAESFDESGGGATPDGPFGDLAGSLDGPNAGNAGFGQYANLDQTGPNAGGLIGGLAGLVERFRAQGLGDVIDSWIGRGDNRPIDPSGLQAALGPETIDDLAQRAGMNRKALLGELAELLPDTIDQLTPEGRLPREDEMRGW